MKCRVCDSYAINHHLHGRDGTDPDLCDVCYWRNRAELRPDSESRICIIPTNESVYAFWKAWEENGETDRHGYYESTWIAINAALNTSGVVKTPRRS